MTANDLTAKNTYTIMLNSVATGGIDLVAEKAEWQPATIYNVSGQRVNSAKRGNIYIEKGSDGQAKKVIK